ncbi:MAG: hypothetical protein U1F43_02635 [Myxococcota bacterium]
MSAALGATWGVVGVALLLLDAIARVGRVAYATVDAGLDGEHVASLVAICGAMAWAEGYRGFQRGLSPRIVRRAVELARAPRAWHVVAAPLYCLELVAAPRATLVRAWSLLAMIVGFVVIVAHLPAPWRGLVDAGVVVGLAWGLASLAVFSLRAAAGIDRAGRL